MTEWFEQLFGFREKDFSYADRQAQFEFLENGTKLRARPNGQTYEVGTFECLSLAHLRQVARDDAAAVTRTRPTTVRHIASTDVFLLHCDRDNRGALFQGASQFNCLEFVSPRGIPENGVTCYAMDNTQGPACAIAAGPATVVRNYFARVGDQVGQTAAHQLNNLDGVQRLLPPSCLDVVNGYTDSTDARLAALNKCLAADPALRTAATDALKIGVHWHVQVPFADRRTVLTHAAPHVVSQVYCSAISVGYSAASSAAWAPFASLVLEASYEATLWAGVLNCRQTGCPTVFLTLLGGGVFRNREDWIVGAIAKALGAVAAYGLDVVVVHFRHVDRSIVDALESAMQ
ncbi:Aste57867_21038 [Aphanomyces stellatus]|uniref:Aste57867_21038 protein n=1 Tax=Aphanomyces stellatus TaxID=120398 RepID=A0A485LIK9_9STRA|nr:hypothetical protein As57867_020970 [Aphanomyces stellatus]VFT97713.1 Aste57867_21038 [Aphanomyces stellatus]